MCALWVWPRDASLNMNEHEIGKPCGVIRAWMRVLWDAKPSCWPQQYWLEHNFGLSASNFREAATHVYPISENPNIRCKCTHDPHMASWPIYIYTRQRIGGMQITVFRIHHKATILSKNEIGYCILNMGLLLSGRTERILRKALRMHRIRRKDSVLVQPRFLVK